MAKTIRLLPWLILLISFVLLAAHVTKWDKLQVDGTTLALIGIILVVPLLEQVRKVRLGEFEAEIAAREVADVRAKVSGELPAPEEQKEATPSHASILELVRQDPQLGLAKLRIELEQVLKALYQYTQPQATGQRFMSIGRLAQELSRAGFIQPQLASGLGDVISLANRAVHGEYVRTQDAEELALLGVRILEELRSIYQDQIPAPVESAQIASEEVDRLRFIKYRVTTVVPLVNKPEKKIYVVDQDGLDRLLEGYQEYAEFIVSIEPITG